MLNLTSTTTYTTALQLKYWPDKVLRTKCIECIWTEEERKRIGNEMLEIMFAYNGYGLSAPQVGLTKRIFVMRDPHAESKGLIFTNAKIITLSEEKNKQWEGCLSLLSHKVMLSRANSVEVEFDAMDPYRDSLSQERCSWTFTGIDARCIQHEIDHLNGIMIFDHINGNLAQKLFLEKYAKSKKKI